MVNMLAQISKKDLNIYSETATDITAFCPNPKHNDKNRPNFYITKDNGFGYCFACGFKANIKDLGINTKTKKTPRKVEKKDWYNLWKQYRTEDINCNAHKVNPLTVEWDVSFHTLSNYGYGWNPEEQCHIYPMVEQNEKIIGLQERLENGRKLSVKGSKLGLFVPIHKVFTECGLFITEGYSDCVVCADFGHLTIGRPSAMAIPAMTVNWCLNYIPKNYPITIIADNDTCGLKGGAELLCRLVEKGYKVKGLRPKEKDFRKEVEVYGKEYVRNWLETK